MRYALEFSETALSDIERHKKSGDKSILKEIEKLFNELMEHPTIGSGQTEKLRHYLAGLYFRRISKQHRFIYSIKEEIIIVHVLRYWSYYRDK